MLNAAIIGLGWWGKELVRAVKGSARLRITRGVTLEPERARDIAAECNVAIGTSYEDILADRTIDAVLLATPHSQHRAQVEAAAGARKHVYCEKPFALSKADAVAAIAACRRAGVALGVGHNRRLWPSIARIKELIGGGELGTLMHVEGNYSHDWLANQPPGDWRSTAVETRAGGMTGMGIHLLDAYGFLLGPMRRISARSTRRILPLETGDTTAAFIEFADGMTGTLSTTLKTPHLWRLAVFGSDAWAESASETAITIRRAGGEAEVFHLPLVNHIGMNLESFAAAALAEGTYHIDDDGIVHTVAALEAVFRSVDAHGAWQTVDWSP
jgi:predicted dehydrogenase